MYNTYPAPNNNYLMYQGNPYLRNMAQPQTPCDAVIRVTGLEGARAYANQMTPNSRAVLFDGNEDIMYIISTDGAGFPTTRMFDFSERTNGAAPEYVTRKEFDELKELITNGKQSVRSKSKTELSAE